jgi:hypothetical protein
LGQPSLPGCRLFHLPAVIRTHESDEEGGYEEEGSNEEDDYEEEGSDEFFPPERRRSE